MRRHHHLYEEICSFKNLLLATWKAQKGKRYKNSVSRFNLEIEKELVEIQNLLLRKEYQVGSYKQFYVYDPKKRLISALPYRDRVVQHALCNIIEPIFDRSFIHDSYACRKGRGTHKAVNRFTEFCRKNDYVLKCDIRTYFASIDHQVLYKLIKKKIKDPEVLWLIRTIIDSTPNPGIPIGNLTSQIFAGLYLNGLDHYLKEEIKCRYYIRYMDDLAVFDNDKGRLKGIKHSIGDYLVRLKLTMHPNKCHIFPAKDGVKFLGYKAYADHRLILMPNIKRFRRRMRKYTKLWRKGLVKMQKITCSIQSWLGYAKHADSYSLRRKLFSEIVIKG